MYSYHKYKFCLTTHSNVEELEKMKLNELGRQKPGRYRSPVTKQAQHPILYVDSVCVKNMGFGHSERA